MTPLHQCFNYCDISCPHCAVVKVKIFHIFRFTMIPSSRAKRLYRAVPGEARRFSGRQALLSALSHEWGQGVRGEAGGLCVVNAADSVLSDWGGALEPRNCKGDSSALLRLRTTETFI
ncbi:hypothetical protein F7725_008489 [Dissostichus mawsoni]|uniref:Uncharacterized protein n=1 Tax=Dissostichus mawsoni TaxID=36200 RepID=A0A7J5Y7C1_DISMA|nr:hypothetical protein F7725_008489 [Dissostichus mawsoni]